MLRDPKIARFADAFPRQWLQLRRVGMFAPDKKLYPSYDDYLQKSMVGEATAYFREVLDKNLSLREFLDSDWTMLNARLATHYEIPGVTEDRFERVTLRPQDHGQESHAPPEARRPQVRRHLRRLPPQNRPAGPGLRQLRRHRPLADRRSRPRRRR
jgi:hypothetical protein